MSGRTENELYLHTKITDYKGILKTQINLMSVIRIQHKQYK
jgi:hypothetical protein